MTALALVLSIAFFAVAFIWRSIVQRRRTGDWGFRLDRSGGVVPRTASALMVGGFLAAFSGVVGDLIGVIPRVAAMDQVPLRGAGLLAMGAALLFTVRAQLDLRESWRIGVDPDERTELVTDGLFRTVRNPIFSGMFAFAVGCALTVPTWLTLIGTGVVILGLEIQVRSIEEPYLLRAHGDVYRAYTSRVGRFVPGIGREKAREGF